MPQLYEIVLSGGTSHPLVEYNSLEADHWLQVQFWPAHTDLAAADPKIPAEVVIRKFMTDNQSFEQHVAINEQSLMIFSSAAEADKRYGTPLLLSGLVQRLLERSATFSADNPE